MQIRPANRGDCQSLGEVIVGANRSAFEGRVPEQCLSELPVATSVANWRRAFDAGAFDSGDQVLLIERGERTLAVRVLEPNPNRAFYARLGAHELGSQPYDWAGFATREVIYGWPDISHAADAGR